MIRTSIARRLALAGAVLSFGLVGTAHADGRLLSLSKAGGALHVYDAETFEEVGKYPVGAGPHEVITDASGRYAYAANYGNQQPGNTITVIDLVEGEVMTTIDLGPLSRPHGLAEHNGKIYFTAELAKAVARIDTKTNQVDWIAGTGQGITHMLAVSPKTGVIYTADITGGTVSIIDPSAPPPQSVTRIDVPGHPEGIAVSPDGARVAVGDNEGGTISLIDTQSKRIVGAIEAGGMPIRLCFTPDGKRLLSTDPQAGMFRVFDVEKREKLGEVAVGEAPVGFVLNPDATLALISTMGNNEIVEVDLTKLEVTRRLKTGPAPDGIALVTEQALDSARAAAAAEREEVAQAQRPQPPARPRAQADEEPEEPDEPEMAPAAQPPVGTGRPRLGVLLEPTEEGEGVRIIEIVPDTPAEDADLEVGDIVLEVDGESLEEPAELVRAVSRAQGGQTLTLTIRRDDEQREVKIKLQ